MKRHFSDAGFNPGVVLPSTLAALGAADGKKPTMVIKVDAHTTSIAILNEDQLQLFRTLENARGVTITGEQLAEEVYPSVVFFQDTYHLNIERIYVAGLARVGRCSTRAARRRPEPMCRNWFRRRSWEPAQVARYRDGEWQEWWER